MDDLIQEFLVECYEVVSRIELDLVALEEDPDDLETLKSIFRGFHSIKGACGFVNFSKLESIAHRSESLLDKLRAGERILDHDISNALFAVLDAIREILECVEKTHGEGDTDYTELNANLSRLLCEGGKRSVADAETDEGTERSRVDADSVAQGPAKDAASVSTIRVRVEVLDHLMNLVGELVLARNQVLECSERFNDTELNATSQRLDLVATELQVGVMKTRMQPIATIWSNFPRVVRDLSLSCGKKVQLETRGKETEVDRTLIEAMRDPLTHVVRNCIDHGIEPPEVRIRSGKQEEGRITMSAYHEGGLVNIEIRDDGAGIDLEKVRKRAIALGIVSHERESQMSDRDATELILTAGFSTTEKATNLSGRGVGMDVVKTNIEGIGGTVDVVTAKGQGTSVKIKVPLTLAIIPALIVTTGNQRFALPQVNLSQLVRLEGEAALRGIENVHGAPVYRLRGRLLPIVYLSDQLQLETGHQGYDPTGPTSTDSVQYDQVRNIVVLQADDRMFGLVVDKIHDTQEIVVKPLGKQLRDLDCYAGATIMGDGSVALILDAVGLARRAQMISGTDRTRFSQDEPTYQEARSQTQSMVLFRTSDDGRMAIPSVHISRLEELDRSVIERVGQQDVVQYRGEIMRLVPVPAGRHATAESPRPSSQADTIHVLVFSKCGKSIGIVVDRILDIVDENVTVRRGGSREGVLGVGVLDGRVTEFLDVEELIRKADPSFFEVEENAVVQLV